MVQLPGCSGCGLLPCRMSHWSSSQDGHDITDVNLLWRWNKAKMTMANLWHTPCFSKIHHNRICSWIPGTDFTCELKLLNIISNLNPILHFIELDDGKIYRKPRYKKIVSCRFSLKPIHWTFQNSSLKISNHLKSPPGAHQHLLKATPTAIPSAAEWQNLPGNGRWTDALWKFLVGLTHPQNLSEFGTIIPNRVDKKNCLKQPIRLIIPGGKP